MTTKNPSDLDSILEEFERDDALSGGADLVDYLPDASDPDYERIAVELIRVDLERSWARGSRKRVEAYRQIAPRLFAEPRRLAEIAFEEYRLRRQSGETATAAEYKRRYSIDTSIWPQEHIPTPTDDAPAGLLSTRSLIGSTQVPAFPHAGESFAGFDLVEQLGRGAFGVVFRARQSDLAARDVVLKLTAARSVEPQRLARLQHTNIVPLYSMHLQAGMLAICMPYFGRQTIADVLRSGRTSDEQARLSTVAKASADTLPGEFKPVAGTVANRQAMAERQQSAKPVSISWVVEIIAQLAEALVHAHDREIVHSDLKPANVLLTDDGLPMLLDFNLATDATSQQKQTLLVGGTLPYMAPEHIVAIQNGAPVMAASDIYSLGVIAFELLAGRRPFPDHTGDFDRAAELLISDRNKSAPRVRDANPCVSVGLSAIVSRCLEPNLDCRYATARQLAEDLRRHQQDLPLRHTPERSLRERGLKWIRRNARGVRIATAAIFIALVASLSAMYLARQSRMADLEAAAAFNDFQSDVRTALLNLHAPGTEPVLHALGQNSAQKAVTELGLLEPEGNGLRIRSRLNSQQQSEIRAQGADLLYELASQSAQRRKFSEALHYNSAALNLYSLTSGSRALLEQRKQLLSANGDSEGASLITSKISETNPDEYDRYLAAKALLEDRRFPEAVAAWKLLSDENRHDPLRWLLLGNAYVGVGRLTDAEACYTALIALLPNATNGYLYRGLCRNDQGNFAAAEEDLTAALALNPSVPTTRINRAIAYFNLGNVDAADRDATAAINAGIGDSRAFFVRALIRDKLNKHAEARADRDKGFATPPSDDKGWVARGIAALRETPERAALEFAQGAQAFPNSRPLLQNLIHVYGDRLGKVDIAIGFARKLVDLNPDDPSALAGLAVLTARKGDNATALQYAARAGQNHPAAVTSLQLASAYALVAKTNPSETTQAIDHLKRALASDPKLVRRAATDPDLASMHSSPEFKSILAAAHQLTEAKPPTTSSAPAAEPTPSKQPQLEKTQQAS